LYNHQDKTKWRITEEAPHPWCKVDFDQRFIIAQQNSEARAAGLRQLRNSNTQT